MKFPYIFNITDSLMQWGIITEEVYKTIIIVWKVMDKYQK